MADARTPANAQIVGYARFIPDALIALPEAMNTSLDTRIELDDPFPGALELSRCLIVDGPVAAKRFEPVEYDEAWPEDKPFESVWYEQLEAEHPTVPEFEAEALLDSLERFELEIAPAAERPTPLPAEQPASAAGKFFAGSYEQARASLAAYSYPDPLEQLKAIRNIAELWTLSANETHLLMFLVSRANRDWLLLATNTRKRPDGRKAAGGWLSDLSRISKSDMTPTLDALERKGYIRRLRPAGFPMVVCLRPIGFHEDGTRPAEWRPPSNPARNRGRLDGERVKNVSAAIDAAEGRTFDE